MAASAQDVYRAIESLTPGELLKIREFAVWRVKGLGRKSNGRDHEDLMQEAVTRTVAGDRHWNEGSVSFVVHLLGAMRSISTHWAAQASEDIPVSASELDRAAPDEHGNAVDRVAAAAAGPERQWPSRKKSRRSSDCSSMTLRRRVCSSACAAACRVPRRRKRWGTRRPNTKR